MKMKRLYIAAFALFLVCLSSFGQTALQRKAVSFMLQGVQMLQEGKVEMAQQLLEAAHAADPENDAVLNYLGDIAVSQSKVDEALRYYDAAWRRDSTNYYYNRHLARLYLATGNIAQAERFNEKLLEMKPSDAEVMSYCIETDLHTGNLDRADSLLSRIDLMMGPTDYSRVTRLEILRQRGDFKVFFSALDSMFADVQVPGKLKKETIENMVNSSDPRFNYVHLADYDSLLTTCLRAHPSDTSILHYAAGFYYSLRRYERVTQLCQAHGDDVHMMIVLMYTYTTQEKYREALSVCDKVISLSAGRTDDIMSAILTKAECYQRLGQREAAFREFDKALKINPEDKVLLNNYAYSLSEAGRQLSKAAKMSRKVIAAEGENATYLDTYAWILYKQKKYQAAKVYLKKAMLYGGKESPEILEHYAAILEALGDNTLAAGYLQQAKLKRNGGKK